METTDLLNMFLPYTPAELTCGTKKMWKVKRRGALIELIGDYKDGKEVNFETVLPKDDVQKLLELINQK
jgi:hypothetical protein